MKKHKTHGGPRVNAGRKTKSEAGPRIMWSGRLDPVSIETLRTFSGSDLSQSEIIDQALAAWRSRRGA